jgi:cytochrome c-type biogenesis protein CcmH
MKLFKAALAVFVLLAASEPAFAVEPSEMLDDPALEARAQDISGQLRCVVCQNQTIDDSDAPLAHDMRLLVRERLLAGDSNQQVVGYIVDRYGNFVLLRPPFQANTWLLWFAPFVVLGLALAGLLMQMRRRPAPAPAPLSEQEQAALRVRLGQMSEKES